LDYYSKEVLLNQESLKTQLLRVINSVCIFIVAFALIHMLNFLVNAFIMGLIGYTPKVNFYGIFDIPEDTASWSRKRIIASYAFGPLACLVVGLVSFRIYNLTEGYFSIIRVLALWIGVHGITQFLSNLTTSALGTNFVIPQLYYNYAVIFTWSYISPVFASMFSITGLILSFLFGYFIAADWLNLSASARLVFYLKGRRRFLFQILILPTIIGGLAIIYLGYPFNINKQLSSLATLLLVIIGTLLRSENKSIPLKIYKFDVFNVIPLVPISIVLILIFIIKVIIKEGIPIYFQ